MRNDRLARITATLFGIGYAPFMPGTFASLAGLFLYLLIRKNLAVYCGILAVSAVAGFYASGRAQKLFKATDPREIVIDEFCGILLVYLFIPYTLKNLIVGFALFRLLDISKVYPIGKLERLKKGWGIMLDDITAGICANIILQILTFLRWTL